MKVGDIDPVELAGKIIKNNPKMENVRSVLIEAITAYRDRNFDRETTKETPQEIWTAIRMALQEEVQNVLDRMVTKGKIKVHTVDGEDVYQANMEGGS